MFDRDDQNWQKLRPLIKKNKMIPLDGEHYNLLLSEESIKFAYLKTKVI